MAGSTPAARRAGFDEFERAQPIRAAQFVYSFRNSYRVRSGCPRQQRAVGGRRDSDGEQSVAASGPRFTPIGHGAAAPRRRRKRSDAILLSPKRPGRLSIAASPRGNRRWRNGGAISDFWCGARRAGRVELRGYRPRESGQEVTGAARLPRYFPSPRTARPTARRLGTVSSSYSRDTTIPFAPAS